MGELQLLQMIGVERMREELIVGGREAGREMGEVLQFTLGSWTSNRGPVRLGLNWTALPPKFQLNFSQAFSDFLDVNEPLLAHLCFNRSHLALLLLLSII